MHFCCCCREEKLRALRPSEAAESLALSCVLEGERPLLVLRSSTMEYVITDRAYYHLSMHRGWLSCFCNLCDLCCFFPREVERFLWLSHPITDLSIVLTLHKTAIAFRHGAGHFNLKALHVLKVAASDKPLVVALFRGLSEIAELQARNEIASARVNSAMSVATAAISGASKTAHHGSDSGPQLAARVQGTLKEISSEALSWLDHEANARLLDARVGEILARYLEKPPAVQVVRSPLAALVVKQPAPQVIQLQPAAPHTQIQPAVAAPVVMTQPTQVIQPQPGAAAPGIQVQPAAATPAQAQSVQAAPIQHPVLTVASPRNDGGNQAEVARINKEVERSKALLRNQAGIIKSYLDTLNGEERSKLCEAGVCDDQGSFIKQQALAIHLRDEFKTSQLNKLVEIGAITKNW